MKKTVDIFLGYAVEDKELCLEVKKHFKWFERVGLVRTWHEYSISPGLEKEHEILRYLEMAHIILLFVSADFINSDFCYSISELAMKRHEQGKARVIPIILRSVYWQETPIGKLQALPRGDKLVKSWRDQDKVHTVIQEDILIIIKEVVAEKYVQEARHFLKQKQYEKTLEACEDIISRLLPVSIVAHNLKGFALLALKRYNEALKAYDQLIQLGLSTASVYKERGEVLYHLQKYSEALLSYKEAISLEPDFIDAYKGASKVLRELARENNQLADSYDEQVRNLSQNLRNSTQEAAE